MKHARRPSVFHVFLVRPSKYDDESFVIRHWRAVVPGNSLACMYGLTEDVRQRRVLGEVDLRIHVVDEAVNKMPLDRIFRLNRRTGERVLVCLVGVQTNQFCRAADIALALRRKQVAVMIGGFHIKGILFGGTSTRAPVFGLRPMRPRRWRVWKLPNPRISTLSPDRRARTMLGR